MAKKKASRKQKSENILDIKVPDYDFPKEKIKPMAKQKAIDKARKLYQQWNSCTGPDSGDVEEMKKAYEQSRQDDKEAVIQTLEKYMPKIFGKDQLDTTIKLIEAINDIFK